LQLCFTSLMGAASGRQEGGKIDSITKSMQRMAE
jgi:hypothetical protein